MTWPTIPEELRFYVWLAVIQVALSGLHWLLWTIKSKTKNTLDDRAYEVVDFLLTCLNWLMMNRRNPISRLEVEEAMKTGLANNHDP